MSTLIRIPLRYLLPLLIAVFSLVVLFLSHQNTKGLLLQQVEDQAQTQLRTLMSSVQGPLEHMLRNDDIDAAKSLIATFGSMRGHQAMFLADPQGTILAATRLASIDSPWTQFYEGLDQQLISRVNETGGIELRISPDGGFLSAYAPVCGPVAADQLRAAQCGLLFCRHGLQTRKHVVIDTLRAQTALNAAGISFLALLLGLVIHGALTARLQRLVIAAQRFIAGERHVRTQTRGSDEIAQAGKAVDRLLDTVVDDQEKLHASEQRLRSMVETMPAGAVYREGDTITLNRTAEEIIGYQRSELKTLDEWFTALYGSEATTVRKYYEQDRGTGFPNARTLSLTRKDGEQRQVEFAAARSANGEIWLLHDITERAQAEAARRLSEAHVKSILDTAVDGIINIDTTGRIQTVNAAALATFGYKSEELIGENVKMLMPEPFHHEHDGYIGNYLRTGEKKIIGIGREVEGLRKDGSIFPLELSVSEIKSDREHSFTGIVRDISERRYAEEKLRLREEELRLTFENAPMGIAMLGPGGELLSANRSFCVMVDHTENELLEMTIRDVTHPDDRSESEKLFRQAMNGETAAYTLEKRHLKKDGSVIHGILRCAVVHDASGAPFRLVAQLEDRTEQVKAAEEARVQR
ncbi:MAG: PAS domain S-box protein, partial [Gammaproteobacteria bacterium]